MINEPEKLKYDLNANSWTTNHFVEEKKAFTIV